MSSASFIANTCPSARHVSCLSGEVRRFLERALPSMPCKHSPDPSGSPSPHLWPVWGGLDGGGLDAGGLDGAALMWMTDERRRRELCQAVATGFTAGQKGGGSGFTERPRIIPSRVFGLRGLGSARHRPIRSKK